MRLLAADVKDIFGTVDPGGPTLLKQQKPMETFGILIAYGIRYFIIVASLAMLFYLLWGAYDWVVSSGEKERISKAQGKMTQAVLGIIIMIASLTIWELITRYVLGIVTRTPGGGWLFKIPTL